MNFSASPETLIEGLAFAEGPRWHNGALYFSDMHSKKVLRLNAEGSVDEIAHVEACPSGLGWLPDGRLLIVSMEDRKLLRLEADGSLVIHADLSALASYHCNDMVVTKDGNAYVGHFGFDLHAGEAGSFKPAQLILVTPDGAARHVADDMYFPNGSVITPDGKTLVVGESFGGRLTAFDIQPNGDLANRREWAAIEGSSPDGICMDAAQGIWVTSPLNKTLYRVEEGGTITHEVKPPLTPFACMIGGADGQDLFVLIAEDSHPDHAVASCSGKIIKYRVDVPRGEARP